MRVRHIFLRKDPDKLAWQMKGYFGRQGFPFVLIAVGVRHYVSSFKPVK